MIIKTTDSSLHTRPYTEMYWKCTQRHLQGLTETKKHGEERCFDHLSFTCLVYTVNICRHWEGNEKALLPSEGNFL